MNLETAVRFRQKWMAKLSVENEGPRIEEEDLDDISERFSCVDASRNHAALVRAASSSRFFFLPDLLLCVLEIGLIGDLRRKVIEIMTTRSVRLLSGCKLSVHLTAESLRSMVPQQGLSSDYLFFSSVFRSIHSCRRSLFGTGGFCGASDQFLVSAAGERGGDGIRWDGR